jgi:hypothetical protein
MLMIIIGKIKNDNFYRLQNTNTLKRTHNKNEIYIILQGIVFRLKNKLVSNVEISTIKTGILRDYQKVFDESRLKKVFRFVEHKRLTKNPHMIL